LQYAKFYHKMHLEIGFQPIAERLRRWSPQTLYNGVALHKSSTNLAHSRSTLLANNTISLFQWHSLLWILADWLWHTNTLVHAIRTQGETKPLHICMVGDVPYISLSASQFHGSKRYHSFIFKRSNSSYISGFTFQQPTTITQYIGGGAGGP